MSERGDFNLGHVDGKGKGRMGGGSNMTLFINAVLYRRSGPGLSFVVVAERFGFRAK